MIDETILARIKENASSFTELTLDDPSLSDEDIKSLIDVLPLDSNISRISIKSHRLTNASYPLFLDLVKSRPNLISFSCTPIWPISVGGSMYNEAINTLLQQHRAYKKKEIQESTSFDATDQPAEAEAQSLIFSKTNGACSLQHLTQAPSSCTKGKPAAVVIKPPPPPV